MKDFVFVKTGRKEPLKVGFWVDRCGSETEAYGGQKQYAQEELSDNFSLVKTVNRANCASDSSRSSCCSQFEAVT